jgi:hypothetical protein
MRLERARYEPTNDRNLHKSQALSDIPQFHLSYSLTSSSCTPICPSIHPKTMKSLSLVAVLIVSVSAQQYQTTPPTTYQAPYSPPPTTYQPQPILPPAQPGYSWSQPGYSWSQPGYSWSQPGYSWSSGGYGWAGPVGYVGGAHRRPFGFNLGLPGVGVNVGVGAGGVGVGVRAPGVNVGVGV